MVGILLLLTRFLIVEHENNFTEITKLYGLIQLFDITFDVDNPQISSFTTSSRILFL